MIKKKLIILVLSIVLIFPAIQSKAFIFLGAPAVGLMSAGEVAGALTGIGLAGLIGQQLGWIDLPSLDPDKDDVRLPLTPLTRDRPVANPDLPQTAAPTAQITYYCQVSGSYQRTGSSYDEACAASFNTRSYLCPNYYEATGVCYEYKSFSAPNTVYYDQVQYCPSANCSGGATLGQRMWSSTTSSTANVTTSSGGLICGTGYTLQGSECVLTNANAIPDGKADIEVIDMGNGALAYRAVPDDPDQNAGLTLSQGAALFKILHPDYVDGHPPGYWDNRNDAPAVHVAIDPSGGASGMCPYQTCIPIPGLPGHFRISALSNTSTGAQVAVIDVNSSSGVVDQAVTIPLAGQILNPGQTYTNTAGVVSTVQAGQVVLANATGATYTQTTQTAAPAASINIPTDYARTGEATTAAKSITDKLAEAPESTGDLGEPALENPLSSYFNPLRSWSVPTQSGTCPTGSFSWNDHTYTFDVICQLFNENLPIIQGAMNVLYVLAALFIVLGA